MMMAGALGSSLMTLLTITLGSYVHTSSRTLDNCIISLLIMAITSICGAIKSVWHIAYNRACYRIFNAANNPLQMRKIPYYIETTTDLTHAAITKNKWIAPIVHAPGTYAIRNEFLNRLFMENNVCMLTDDKGRPITNDASPATQVNGLHFHTMYIIAISSNGRRIFAEVKNDVICIYSDPSVQPEEIHQIRDAIHTRLCEYVQANCQEMSDETTIYEMRRNAQGITQLVKCGVASPKKNLNVLYLEKKEKLLTAINAFKCGKMYPDGISIDNKLTILAHGPPGTGKSALAIAIAKDLRRSLTVLNLATMHYGELRKCLTESVDKTVFLFDEFDCLIDDNNEMAAREDKQGYVSQDLDKQRITLSLLLSLLDGIFSANGRVIVMTTNKIENIEPRVIRAVRVDLRLHMSYCTRNMLTSIMAPFYKESNADFEDIMADATIVEMQYTPCEIISMCREYIDDFPRMLEILSTPRHPQPQ